MSFHAAILADSIGPHGIRLTTFEVTFPQMVLRDMTRHRALSYSFESTRAVPTEARIEQVETNPYIPTFMRRSKGMGGGEPLTPGEQALARGLWLQARDQAVKYAKELLWTGKEHVGRILEPYGWITGIISGTEWENYFALRCPPPDCVPDPIYPAQYELQVIAHMQETLYRESEPRELRYGQWHLPLVSAEEQSRIYPLIAPPPLARVSAGRCAAVSYLNHHKASDVQEPWKRWDEKLVPFAHWSPGEHPAECVPENEPNLGNFAGFKQLRKFYPNEAVRPRNIEG